MIRSVWCPGRRTPDSNSLLLTAPDAPRPDRVMLSSAPTDIDAGNDRGLLWTCVLLSESNPVSASRPGAYVDALSRRSGALLAGDYPCRVNEGSLVHSVQSCGVRLLHESRRNEECSVKTSQSCGFRLLLTWEIRVAVAVVLAPRGRWYHEM